MIMKNIVVFAGNECSKDRESYYYSLAYKTGKLLAENGFTVVSGGGPGLMDEVMHGAFKSGGKTIAVCLEIVGRKFTEFASEKSVYKMLNERQNKLISLGDAFLSLPGGVGTFYEISAILALKRKGEIDKGKPLILIDGYFQNLKPVFANMVSEGFIDGSFNSYYDLVNSPEVAVNLLKKVTE